MFNNEKEELKARVATLEKQLNASYSKSDVENIKLENKREIATLEHNHSIKVKELEFEMKNFKDTEILEKNKEIVKLTNSNAVLTKENEMMKEMVDINADIVDVKDIINKLIDKLPEINLNKLMVPVSK